MGVVKDFISGIYNLLLGLKVTGLRLPEKSVTLQYPDEKWEMPERSRGIVVLLSDKETGELNCTACMLCMRACPTAAIQIERDKNEKGKWYAKAFTVDNTICCFCGLCEDACNFDAIKLATYYENSVYNQSELVWDKDKLQEMGRDVPYTPKRPKKKAAAKPAPKPAPKPAEGSDAGAPDKPKPAEDAKPQQAASDKPSEKAEANTDKKEPDNKPAEPKAEDKPSDAGSDKDDTGSDDTGQDKKNEK